MSKPMDNPKPKIYGFNNGGRLGFLEGALLAEDGTYLGGHICSDESYMRKDLGIIPGSRPDRLEAFAAHYPDGYEMEFVSHSDVPSHEGLQAAIAANARAMLTASKEAKRQDKSDAKPCWVVHFMTPEAFKAKYDVDSTRLGGFYLDPETEDCVIDARAALARAKENSNVD